jgi:LysR family glycine cleavage system transcriptional activator
VGGQIVNAESRRIGSLEELLDVPVLERQHNKLKLTVFGSELLTAVELGLGHLTKVINQIGTRRNDSRLTIACGFSFATMWLQPRFSKFRHLLDGLELHLIASEFPDELDPELTDIRVLWQDNSWPDREVRTLFVEDTFPICSPSFAATHGIAAGEGNALGKLARLPLLHYNPGEPKYLDCAAWFRLQGVNYDPEDSIYVFDNYQFTVQAALQGEGIALGFSVLVEGLLSKGELIQVGPKIHSGDSKIFIEFDSNRLDQATRDKVFDWLSLEAHHY